MEQFDLKKKLIVAGVILAIGLYAYVGQLPKEATNVLINGQVVGNTLTEDLVAEKIQTMIDEEISSSDYDLVLKSTITYEATKVKKEAFTEETALLEAVDAALDYNALAQEILIDEEPFVTLGSKKDADALLDAVTKQFLSEDEVIIKSEFVEDVQVLAKECELEDIVTYEAAWEEFQAGRDELLTYKVAAGDTTWDIAAKFDMYVSDIAAANPETDIELIQIGQVIKLNIPMAYINVRTVTNETVEEGIANKVIYEKTDSMYVGESKLKEEGAYGKKIVELERVSINGVLEDQVVLSEEVVEEPIATVILSGSKWREVASSGELMKPTSGTLTSRFGTRWGRMHEGIDIGTPIGTKVMAADDGIVTKVGYISGYGKTVILDHGNGRSTLYGHLNGYNVQVGQSVKKGSKIATTGATGSVTGPCLHFEVRENGVPRDPLKYIVVQ